MTAPLLVVLAAVIAVMAAVVVDIFLRARQSRLLQSSALEALASELGTSVLQGTGVEDRKEMPSGPGHRIEWTREGVWHCISATHDSVMIRARSRRGSLSRLSVYRTESGLRELPEDKNPLERKGAVCCEVEEEALLFLNPRVCRNLELITRLGYTKGVVFKTESDMAVLNTGSALSEQGRLRFFMHLALPVLARALDVCSHLGVEWLERQSGEEGECQICGCRLDGVIVRCVKCGTPHHEDCWKYTGVCSTYACGGKETRP